MKVIFKFTIFISSWSMIGKELSLGSQFYLRNSITGPRGACGGYGVRASSVPLMRNNPERESSDIYILLVWHSFFVVGTFDVDWKRHFDCPLKILANSVWRKQPCLLSLTPLLTSLLRSLPLPPLLFPPTPQPARLKSDTMAGQSGGEADRQRAVGGGSRGKWHLAGQPGHI